MVDRDKLIEIAARAVAAHVVAAGHRAPRWEGVHEADRAVAAAVIDALQIEDYGTWHHRWFTDELERDEDRGDNRLYRIRGIESGEDR